MSPPRVASRFAAGRLWRAEGGEERLILALLPASGHDEAAVKIGQAGRTRIILEATMLQWVRRRQAVEMPDAG